MDPYDLLPYLSQSFPETHPEHLAVLGRLYGIPGAPPESCRLLELGCASGGNLIPMAWRLPGAYCLGVDLSARQINEGRAMIQALGLGNIELRQGDILDLELESGSFDYIIAHGLYSWVPEAVRTRLLALAARSLAPNGLLYLSYNVLPGWRLRGTLRDILLDACREASHPPHRLALAQAALQRLSTALSGLEALSARLLREEIARVQAAHPSYLYFEYLDTHNQAFLFRDIMAQVGAQGLAYLCDTELHMTYGASYGDQVEAALADLKDPVEWEQWVDFVTNRNFRQSLFHLAGTPVWPEISIDEFDQLAFSSDLQPPPKADLRRARSAPFACADGSRFQVEHPLTKAVLIHLNQYFPSAFRLEELLPIAQRRVMAAGGGQAAGETANCIDELFSLFIHRAVSAYLAPRRYDLNIMEHPRASALALAQVAGGHTQVTTIQHRVMELDSLSAACLRHLDGERGRSEVIDALIRDLESGELHPPREIPWRQLESGRLRERLGRVVDDLLPTLRRHGLLAEASSRECRPPG